MKYIKLQSPRLLELLPCEFGFSGCGVDADLFAVYVAAPIVLDTYATFKAKLQLPCLQPVKKDQNMCLTC